MDIEKLKQKVLDLAIRGKLVPQDPNDEPASVLIEKIRKEKEELVKQGKIKASKNESYIYKGSDNCYYENNGFYSKKIDSNLPFGWVKTKLGNIGIWGAGATPLRSNKAFYESGTIPWIKTGELNNGDIYDSEEKITSLALEKCSLRKIKTNDVLIAMYGATIGKLGIAKKEMTSNQACCACTPFSFIYYRYLFYYLLAIKPDLTKQGFGGAQPNISKEKILNNYISFPSIQKQIEICEKIEKVLTAIDNIQKETDNIIKYIGLCKSKILDYYFGENSTYKSYYEKCSILDDIEILDHLRRPVNKNERLERLAKNKNKYPYYGATGQAGEIDDYIYDGEVVLLGEDGAPFLDKYLDKAYIVSGKFWVNNHAHILKSKSNNKFLLYFLNWIDYSKYVSGTTRLKLSQGNFIKIPFIRCDENVKKEIVLKIENAFKTLEKIKEQIII